MKKITHLLIAASAYLLTSTFTYSQNTTVTTSDIVDGVQLSGTTPDSLLVANRFFNSIIDGNADNAERLIEFGVNVDSRIGLGNVPPIVLAIMSGHLHIVELLLKHGASPNPYPLNENGYSTNPQPLLVAAGRAPLDGPKFIDIMKALLDAGANPNDINQTINGFCPLIMIITYVQNPTDLRNAVTLLLDKGANPNATKNVNSATPSVEQLTALHVAVMRNKPEIVSLLLERGADPLIKSSNGKTPIELSEICQLDNITDLLKQFVKNPQPQTQLNK